jgi:hypothetical protein
MQLYTSNFYTQQSSISNSQYIKSLLNKDFDKIFCSYKDFYLLSNIENKLFPNFIKVVLEIPDNLLYESNFVPFYLLENTEDYPFEFFHLLSEKVLNFKTKKKRSNKIATLVDNTKIYYIKKSDFIDSFIVDYNELSEIKTTL